MDYRGPFKPFSKTIFSLLTCGRATFFVVFGCASAVVGYSEGVNDEANAPTAAQIKSAIASFVAPIFASAVAGEIDSSRCLPLIAEKFQDETGCSDKDAIFFASSVAKMLT